MHVFCSNLRILDHNKFICIFLFVCVLCICFEISTMQQKLCYKERIFILFIITLLVLCPPGRFQCDSGECIFKDKRCNSVSDCIDNSDEKNCRLFDNEDYDDYVSVICYSASHVTKFFIFYRYSFLR